MKAKATIQFDVEWSDCGCVTADDIKEYYDRTLALYCTAYPASSVRVSIEAGQPDEQDKWPNGGKVA